MRNCLLKIIEAFFFLYKLLISPLLGERCRFHPTCSEYALESIKQRGFVRGGLLSVWRILRCQPFCAGGFDPVPGEVKSGR
ncbi:MAG: membrane protein insertion efficiency factor YidD [Bdellovibrionales bacterium]|nr:membrane protein insertion efficiency factor YidD [Bdellovibrionales bacterium]